MGVALAAMLVSSFLLYGWAMRAVFATTRGMPRALSALSVVATVVCAVQVYDLLTAHVNAINGTLAATMYVGALSLFAWAARVVDKHRLPIAFDPALPTAIVTVGPYRYLRHPFYVAYATTWLAGAVATRALADALGLALMCTFYIYLAISESRRLRRSPRADEYLAYLAKSRR